VSHRLTNLYKPLREKERKRKKGDRERERVCSFSQSQWNIRNTRAKEEKEKAEEYINSTNDGNQTGKCVSGR